MPFKGKICVIENNYILMSRMVSVQVRFPGNELEWIDSLVKNGEYSSRSDCVRDAVRKMETVRSFQRLSLLLEKKGITFDDLLKGGDEIRASLFSEMFGNPLWRLRGAPSDISTPKEE